MGLFNTMIKLYHYSNKKFDTVKPSFFGHNHFTRNDVIACKVARAFFYLNNAPNEYRFFNSRYRYKAVIAEQNLYDLRTDTKGLKAKYSGDVSGLLAYCKRLYKGIIYNTGFDIVCLFSNTPVTRELHREKTQ